MPKQHPIDRKIAAIQILVDNFGNVAQTSQDTGIPRRTLYTWKRDLLDNARAREQHSDAAKTPPVQQQSPPQPVQVTPVGDLSDFVPSPGNDYYPPADCPQMMPVTADMDETAAMYAWYNNISVAIGLVSQHITDGMEYATPYHRILALNELVRGLERIKNFIGANLPQTLRVEFVQPDGTVSAQPPWVKDPSD